MKTMNRFFFAALLIMCFATVTSCDKNVIVTEANADEVKPSTTCVLTVEAIKGEDEMTRALADAGTTITATWEVNDEVTVYDSGDNELGTIRATTAGASTTLSGTLDSTPVLGDALILKFKSPTYSGQDGTLDYIAANCDYATATVTVVDADKEYGTAVTSKANFINQQAIVKFTLKNKSGSADLPVTSLSISDGTNSYTVTPGSATNVLYVALPGFSDQTMTLIADTEKYGLVRTGVTFENGNYYTRTVKMHPYFTVDSGKHVLFSPGNLQATYNGTSWSWAFAANQWDYIGSAAGNTSVNGNGTVSSSNVTVDLFGWVGASNNISDDGLGNTGNAAIHGIMYYKTALASNSYYGSSINEELRSDWSNTINDGYTWRTLTKGEWEYLFYTRDGSTVGDTDNARIALATINTDGTEVNGIILFPDGATIASSEFTTLSNVNTSSTWDAASKCTTAQWAALAAKGCVFLPAAGRRSGSTVEYPQNAYYWSSSHYTDNTHAYAAYTFNGNLMVTSSVYRYAGCSVRLVQEL